MKLVLSITAVLFAGALSAQAEVVVASRTLKSRAILQPDDLELREGSDAGAFSDIADIVGLEARVVLYQGRPITRGDVGPPALIERNQLITVIFKRGGLTISAEARSLGRAAVGERLRVMNTASRKTVTGTVTPDGDVIVGDVQPPASN